MEVNDLLFQLIGKGLALFFGLWLVFSWGFGQLIKWVDLIFKG